MDFHDLGASDHGFSCFGSFGPWIFIIPELRTKDFHDLGAPQHGSS